MSASPNNSCVAKKRKRVWEKMGERERERERSEQLHITNMNQGEAEEKKRRVIHNNAPLLHHPYL